MRESSKTTIYVGLDVHKESIAVAYAPEDRYFVLRIVLDPLRKWSTRTRHEARLLVNGVSPKCRERSSHGAEGVYLYRSLDIGTPRGVP